MNRVFRAGADPEAEALHSAAFSPPTVYFHPTEPPRILHDHPAQLKGSGSEDPNPAAYPQTFPTLYFSKIPRHTPPSLPQLFYALSLCRRK